MKNIYLLLSVGLLALIGGASQHARGADLGMENREPIQYTSEPLSTEKLGELLDGIRGLVIDTKSSNWRVRKFEYLSMILSATDSCAQAIDWKFDFSVVPVANVSPPRATGLPGGISPDAINDEKLRKEYEAAIESNRKYAKLYSDQWKRKAYFESMLNRVDIYLRTYLTPNERLVTLQLIEKLQSENAKSGVRALVKAQATEPVN
jgi:hypothetical protein